MIDDFFHQFLLDGGQVSSSIRSGSTVTLPDYWWDIYNSDQREEAKIRILDIAVNCSDFPGISVTSAAEQLQIPYHEVIKLLKLQKLGALKIGRPIQIYQPSILAYIEGYLRRKSCKILLS